MTLIIKTLVLISLAPSDRLLMAIMAPRLLSHPVFLDGLPLNHVLLLLNPPGQGFPQQARLTEATTLLEEETEYLMFVLSNLDLRFVPALFVLSFWRCLFSF